MQPYLNTPANTRSNGIAAPAVTGADAAELCLLADQIRYWQTEQGYTTAELLRRYRGLGSDKTFKSICDRRISELDAEGWLTKYRAVWAVIESLTAQAPEAGADEVLTLSGVNAVRMALMPVFVEEGNARLVFVTGDTGTGKTSIARWLLNKFGERLIELECFRAWDDRPNAFLGDVLRALGKPVNKDVTSAADKLRACIEELRVSRRCLLLEEAHHLGPRCLDTVKALINQTPGEFVMFAMPTLWNRLKQSAYEECRQLSGNRLAERVALELKARDIEMFLKARLDIDPQEAATAAGLLMHHAARHGNLAFVRDVIARVRKAAKGGPVAVELITQASASEIASR